MDQLRGVGHNGYTFGSDPPSAAGFAQVFASAYEASRASGVPRVNLVPGGLTPARWNDTALRLKPKQFTKDFLDELAALDPLDTQAGHNLKKSFDAVSVHLYPVDDRNDKYGRGVADNEMMGDDTQELQDIEDALTSRNYTIQKPGGTTGVPIWVTEMGFSAQNYLTNPETDARLGPDGGPLPQAHRLCLAYHRVVLGQVSMLLVHRVFNDSVIEPSVDYGVWGDEPRASPRKAYNVFEQLFAEVGHRHDSCKKLVANA